ncbi:DNA-binding transcriptional regulator [Yoonia sp. R2331]|uniref:DNA-binding transcriptional regulator n=1 Tax=Yoonia sp. R2331 TaxID=3237238 RepID=UPI0034E3C372
MASYSSIRSVERSLMILAQMNRRPISRVQELASELVLAPATVVRALETLTALGYVQKQSRRTGYTLTEKVGELSSGFHGLPTFVNKAKPILEDLTHHLLWPAALSTIDNNSMIIRLSTIPNSPLSHTHSTLQKRLNLLTRAHGRAYLAFCPLAERRRLFSSLCEARESFLSPQELEAQMEPHLERIRSLGFAERDHDIDPETTTIAVPIKHHRGVAAVVGLTYFQGAHPKVSTLLAGLKFAAEKIEELVTSEQSEL